MGCGLCAVADPNQRLRPTPTPPQTLSLPLNTASVVSTRSLPTTLTGSDLTVADFGMTKDAQGNIYLAGGQDSNGDLVSFSSIGKWTKAGGWITQATTGDVPAGRIGASLVAHPTLDML
jgi:hypothetical protein